MIGATEILVVCGVAVFLFGGSKAVEWAKNIRKAKDEILLD